MLQIEREDDASTAVVDAFLAGDENALAEIYGRWSPLVYSVALRTLGGEPEAEQVTQRVFTTAWTRRQTLDPATTQLPAWLIQITQEQLSGARTHGNGPGLGQPSAVNQPDARIQTADLLERLLLADEISRLEDEPRQVLRMALFEGSSHTEIAERLHLPMGTVRKHIEDSLTKLRKRLEVKTDAY